MKQWEGETIKVSKIRQVFGVSRAKQVLGEGRASNHQFFGKHAHVKKEERHRFTKSPLFH